MLQRACCKALPPVPPAAIDSAAPDDRDVMQIASSDQRCMRRLFNPFPTASDDGVISWFFTPQHHRTRVEMQRELALQKKRSGDVLSRRKEDRATAALRASLNGRLNGVGVQCLTVATRAVVAHVKETRRCAK